MDDVLCTQPVDGSISHRDVSRNMTCSIYVELPENPLKINIDHGLSVVGRENDCKIMILDRSLSRRHALIELDENCVCTIMDTQSLNGTLRNQLQLKPHVRYELRSGDVLQFGDVKCKFVVDSSNSEGESFGEQTQLSDISKATDKPVISSDATENTRDAGCPHLTKSFEETNLASHPVDTVEQPNQVSLSSPPTPALPQTDESDQDSVASARLLADVVIDTEDLSADLLPNPSQFIDGSPCLDDNSRGPIHPSPGNRVTERGSDSPNRLCDVLVRETEALDDDEHGCHKAIVPPRLEDSIVTVGESEPFTDSLFRPGTTATPILSKPAQPSTGHQAIRSPRSSDRPPFVVGIGVAPISESNSINKKPDATRVTLARDSDPGPFYTPAEDTCVTHSTWMELPETQPNDDDDNDNDDLTHSMLCVEESRLFVSGVAHSSRLSEQVDLPIQSDGLRCVNTSSSSSLSDRAVANVPPSPEATQPMLAGDTSFGSVGIAQIDCVSSNREKSQSSMDTAPVDDQVQTDREMLVPVSHSSQQQPGTTQSDASIEIKATRAAPPIRAVAKSDQRSATPERTSLSPGKFASPTVDDPKVAQSTRGDHVNQVPIEYSPSDHFDSASQLTQPMMQSVSATRNTIAITPVEIEQSSESKQHRLLRPRTSFLVTPETPLEFTAKRKPSCKSTTRLIRHRQSSVVLSNVLGVVHFRSRYRRRRGGVGDTNLLTDTEDSPSSASCLSENMGNLELAESSWAPIRRVSCMFGPNVPQTVPAGKPIVRRAERTRNRNSRLGVPIIPSPVRFSGSLLSEDPSQSDEGLGMPVDENSEALDVKPLNSRATSNEASRVDTSESFRSPSAFALAGFEDSPTEKNSELVSDRQHPAGSHQSSFTNPSDDVTAQCKLEQTDRSREASPTFAVPRCIAVAGPKSRVSRRQSEHPLRSRPRRRTCTGRSSRESSDKESDSEYRPGKRARLSGSRDRGCVAQTRRSRRLTESAQPEQSVKVEQKQKDDEDMRKTNAPRARLTRRRTDQVKADFPVKSDPDESDLGVVTRGKRRRSHKPSGPVHVMNTSLASALTPPLSPSRLECSVVLDGQWIFSNNTQVLFSGVAAHGFAKLLASMGVTETEDVLSATLLVTDRVKRTRKVLFARARGIPVVSVDWLTKCSRVRKPPYPDPLQFLFDFRFPTPVPVSRTNTTTKRVTDGMITPEPDSCSKFMAGWHVACTQSVLPPAEDLAQLTRIAGGCWMSDRELDRAVANQLPRAVILCDPVDLAHDQLTRSKNKARRGSIRPGSSVIRALEHLPCVGVDWFLQAVMQRQSPQWPIDKEHRLYPSC